MIQLDVDFLYRHAKEWAIFHRSGDYDPQEYAKWFVEQYEGDPNPPSHPSAERGFLA